MSVKLALSIITLLFGSLVIGSQVPDCNERCASSQNGEDLLGACQRGCRLYNLKSATDGSNGVFSPLLRGFPFFEDNTSAWTTCSNDCKSAYDVALRKSEACTTGCSFKDQEENQNGFGGNGFTISFGNMPGFGDISNMFDRVHQQMKQQHEEFQQRLFGSNDKVEEKEVETNKVEEDKNESIFDQITQNAKNMLMNLIKSSPFGDSENEEPMETSGGELTVIKSGPGYHSEKTYHLGPNADIGKILSNKMDDMILHDNPMEKYSDKEQVEVFKPVQVETEDTPNGWGLFKVLTGDFNDGLNNDLDGPKLPETGLKSRPFGKNVDTDKEVLDLQKFMFVEDRTCYRDSSSMSWSDWLSCLHVKMGLPNWLLAASVAMGVLFTLWICLMIPSNAPKQRVKREQKMINTKEIEANTVSTIIVKDSKLGMMDLPPSYDDVTKTEKGDLKIDLEPVHVSKDKIILDEKPPKTSEDQNDSVA